eukprot:Gregarina_sp_Poly_1__8906@NODE_538_length_7624_cov_89_908694_g425_i0_p8_GENE_NODE_538_length_7624_cov_89_908694_g425_i0NODE_538_length_7624_cov_89_908694_g425_i0_p8_ORF_typecomplete_len120_score0_16DUF3844/PF12955_7/4e05EGF_alliinase/PF04863_13/0_0012Laminin_EGF/PF00053_24/0_009EGF_Tenascin/PF18720_1/0_017EGF_2/PF07974_13/0_026EGF/PF00008_27/0_13_NODE_538_length_7624_cov_89_908694_g425_i052795638
MAPFVPILLAFIQTSWYFSVALGHTLLPQELVAVSDPSIPPLGALESQSTSACFGRNCNGHGRCWEDAKEINGYICRCEWHWSGRDCQVQGPGTFWPVFIASASTLGSFVIIALLVTAP